MKIITADLPQYSTLEIYPLADVHTGDPLQDKKRVRGFFDEVQAQENRYIIVNGDIINNAVRNGVSDIYTEELNPNQQIDATVALLEQSKTGYLSSRREIMRPGPTNRTVY